MATSASVRGVKSLAMGSASRTTSSPPTATGSSSRLTVAIGTVTRTRSGTPTSSSSGAVSSRRSNGAPSSRRHSSGLVSSRRSSRHHRQCSSSGLANGVVEILTTSQPTRATSSSRSNRAMITAGVCPLSFLLSCSQYDFSAKLTHCIFVVTATTIKANGSI